MVTDDLLAAATHALDRDVARLGGADVAGPSALPGWTRAHVLTHLARNADGLRALLLAARTGADLRMYAAPGVRSADIDAGSARPADVIVDDVLESDRRFLAEAAAMPAEAWDAEVSFSSGQPDPPTVAARTILLMRLNEVAIHHVDLAIGFAFPDVPSAVAEVLVNRYARRYADQGVTVDDVEGPLADRLAWLAGRSDSASLRTRTGAPVPRLPNLG